ncbi:hypothetical protein [Beijerinckia indica]|uniref:Invasion associated locus B family protein n=1 Tax=Beijerinckia indica subsp. indica (strain ATCC 9039 / DSM 1715 / NCIMB 8712) TaxID=395963 RepID=B2IFE1_BEII9|nr:hypothetical protein [Beijerinckia indica]ACB97041.1 hypothetical protein Bind_3484 [Beijerinckia indica subsp. indica ATCC 9039]
MNPFSSPSRRLDRNSLLLCFALLPLLPLPVLGAVPSGTPSATAHKDMSASHGALQHEARAVSAKHAEKTKTEDTKSSDPKKSGKPMLVASFGEWGAYLAQGKDKTCYALAMPKERQPGGLKRDPAYIFISQRPAENVRNEISIIMGFPMKDGSSAKAEIGNARFDLVVKGTNAWVKNPAEETPFIEALKRGSKLVISAPSIKGHVTTDIYSLGGLSQALERVQKDCS